jgi:hypothetical protein
MWLHFTSLHYHYHSSICYQLLYCNAYHGVNVCMLSNEQLRGLAMSLAVYLKVPLFIYLITTVAVVILGWAALCYAATLLCIYRFLLLVKPEERSDTTQRVVSSVTQHLPILLFS